MQTVVRKTNNNTIKKVVTKKTIKKKRAMLKLFLKLLKN